MANTVSVSQLSTLVEYEGQGIDVTQLAALVEYEGQGIDVTQLAALVEFGASGVNATQLLVLIEFEQTVEPCEPHASYSFAGVDITAYCNELDLETAGRELDATHMGSEAEEAESGLASHSVRLAGDWSQAVDDLLGQAALSGRRATGMAQFDNCVNGSRYTWANSAYITNWRVATTARGKAVWSATLRHDGAPVRTIF